MEGESAFDVYEKCLIQARELPVDYARFFFPMLGLYIFVETVAISKFESFARQSGVDLGPCSSSIHSFRIKASDPLISKHDKCTSLMQIGLLVVSLKLIQCLEFARTKKTC